MTVNDNRPDYLKNNEVGLGTVEFEGSLYTYTIVNKNLEPRLPGFLGFPGGEHLFISEEVPVDYRDPQLIHEIIEFTQLQGVEGRCLKALKIELGLIPEEIKDEYVSYRTNFFRTLVDYYRESEDEDFKSEIQGSLEFLLSHN